jgi:hypothetical protein
MRPATTLTVALLLIVLLGAAVVSFFIQPNSTDDPCSGGQSQSVACESPDSTANQQ